MRCVLAIVNISVLYTLLELLLPIGAMKRSAAVSLRLTALLCIAETLVKWGGKWS